jgi:hypothetical protein
MSVKLEYASYAMAFDPGGTTGVAVVQSEAKPWEIYALHLGGQHHLELWRLLVEYKPSIVICETFENRAHGPALLESREYIGVVKMYLQATGTDGEWQSSSTGKQFWDDVKMKEAGLYVAGLRHARDAIRHYAYWRMFKKNDKSLFQGTTAHIKTSPSRSQGS